MSVLIDVNTTANTLGGGTAATTGVGEDWKLTIGGTWAVGDMLTLQLTDSQTGVLTQVGAGTLTGLVPSFAYTYNNKMYLLSGNTVYFSAIGAPTVFNDPTAAGNGFITMSDWFSAPEPLSGIAPFQGKLLFTSRRTTQIWNVDPDPANYSQAQVLTNIGTLAGETLKPVGDMDVYMVADNGIRSVQVRVATNNASVADVGVPIDLLVQPLLASLTDAQKATMCGIVEPSSNRYWAYIPNLDGSVGFIWVFSRFGQEIAAWSTYIPSYNNNGVQTPFVPVKFVVFQGQVWVLDNAGNIYQYGGTNNLAYDNCGVTIVTPFFDGGKATLLKTYTSLDCAFQGSWVISFSPDYILQKYKPVYTNNVPSFKYQRIPIESGATTHYSLQMVENGNGYARFSSCFVNLDAAGKK